MEVGSHAIIRPSCGVDFNTLPCEAAGWDIQGIIDSKMTFCEEI
jgi:hypothetical protein